MSGRNRDGSGVLDRLLRLLDAYEATPGPHSIADLTAATGLPKTTVYRMVTTLTNAGLLTRVEGRYGIGIRFWEIAQHAGRQLRDAARPFLQDLFSLVGETSHLAVREGDEVLYIERLYGSRRLPRASRVGGRLPLHATAVGKAILAFEEEWVREAYLHRDRLERVTRHTIADPGALRRELDEVRLHGWATTREEVRAGSCSVAVPVFQSFGVVAAVGIVVDPSQAEAMTQFIPSLQGISRRIERATAHLPWEMMTRAR